MNKCKVTVVACVLAMLIMWMMASLIFYSLLFFSLCRQAGLNEAAERQYERAAGLRPDVSTGTGGAVYCLSQKRRCMHIVWMSKWLRVTLHSDTVSRSCCSWQTQQNTDLFCILKKALICECKRKKTQQFPPRDEFGGLRLAVQARSSQRSFTAVWDGGSPSCQRTWWRK